MTHSDNSKGDTRDAALNSKLCKSKMDSGYNRKQIFRSSR